MQSPQDSGTPTPKGQRTLIKVFPQNRHLCTASNNAWATQPRVSWGRALSPVTTSEDEVKSPSGGAEEEDVEFGEATDVGNRAFLVQPIHVRTCGVDRMNVVTEHRAAGPM
jgi:hypothetical protein